MCIEWEAGGKPVSRFCLYVGVGGRRGGRVRARMGAAWAGRLAARSLRLRVGEDQGDRQLSAPWLEGESRDGQVGGLALGSR